MAKFNIKSVADWGTFLVFLSRPCKTAQNFEKFRCVGWSKTSQALRREENKDAFL